MLSQLPSLHAIPSQAILLQTPLVTLKTPWQSLRECAANKKPVCYYKRRKNWRYRY